MLKKEDMKPHQTHGVNWIKDKAMSGVFIDMGLGKTIITLTSISELIYSLDVHRVLVVAPKRVAESVWDKEITKWEHLSGLSVSVIKGNEKQRLEAIKVKADVYTVSRDNIAWLCGLYGGMMLPFDMLVIDESSSFKNPKSMRFKAIRKVAASFQRIVLLSGTPSSNGLLDLWSQMYLLDKGERLGKTITSYRDTYFKPAARNGEIIFNYSITKENESIIHSKISDVCMSLSSKDYAEMPKIIVNDIEVEFDSVLTKRYSDFEMSQVLELINSDEPITTLNAVGLSNKLLQFSNGAVYDEDKKYHTIHDLKLDVLEEIIEANEGESILCAYQFQSDVARIMERFKKINPVLLKTNKHIEDWNNKKIRLMLLHPASGGHGLNLQFGGHNLVWFGLNWSLELYQQTNMRLPRPGQEKTTIIHRIICPSTIDSRVARALESKDKTQSDLLDAIKLIVEKYKKS